ncbi:MAG: HAD family hydrolase [Ruminococcaceae bacterium]|nr:HAD family hydrolase [Oscillospiraceae bacterium]
MKITTVLFDLDGTLLPMDQDAFVKDYFGRLSKRLIPHGYEPKALINAIWLGTAAMVKNDGKCLNEEAFWNKFCEIFGENAIKDMPHFDAFYREEFNLVKASCGYTEKANETVQKIKAMGFKVALATNPIFPSIATEWRMKWAGLDKNDFKLYTTYENSCHCKPNVEYYKDVIKALGVKAEECLMVGNDVTEDMIAETLGMKVFLLTHSLINKENKDISVYPNGNFDDLIKFIENLNS